MTAGRWTTAVAGCMLAVLANDAGGQTPKTASKAAKSPVSAAKTTPARPSTLSGVYTNAQATRGRYVYLGSCRYCHDAATHAGKVFEEWWKGKPLSELYSFILERMPKNDPGSLAPEDVADVTAYLLKLNAMPVGKAELYPDPDSLKKYTIELKKSGSGTSTAKGTKP
ncbi:MAG TPA: cytochrome c [Gemmatimonadaceae bacterium]